MSNVAAEFTKIHAEFYSAAQEIGGLLAANKEMRKNLDDNSNRIRQLQALQARLCGDLNKLMANEEPVT